MGIQTPVHLLLDANIGEWAGITKAKADTPYVGWWYYDGFCKRKREGGKGEKGKARQGKERCWKPAGASKRCIHSNYPSFLPN